MCASITGKEVIMKVKVREKVSADLVAGYGKRKALFKAQIKDGLWVTVSVACYKGNDYFLVEHSNGAVECMPL